MKLLFPAIIFASLIIFIGCQSDFAPEEAIVETSAKDDFLALDSEQRKNIWLERISNLDVPSDPALNGQIRLLEKQLNGLKEFELNNEIIKIAIDIAKSVDSGIFANWFCTLDPIEPYRASNDYCMTCVDDMQAILDGVVQTKTGDLSSGEKLPDCNCRWFCATDTLIECSTTKCNETASGCGLFLLGPCDEYEYLCP